MLLNIPYEIYNALDEKRFFDALMEYQGHCCSTQPACKTVQIDIAGKDYYIKQHSGIGYLEIIKNLFQGQRPISSTKNEWLALEKCQQLKIATVPLVGYGEKGINPAKKQSFVMTRALNDMPNMQQVIEEWSRAAPAFLYKRQIIRQLAQMVRALHRAGMCHQELYLKNFLLDTKNIEESQLYLMNLARVLMKENLSDKQRNKDLAALLYSSFNYKFSIKDYFYFLKIYSGGTLKHSVQDLRMQNVIYRAKALYSKTHGHAPILPQGFSDSVKMMDRLNQKLPYSTKPYTVQLADGSDLQLGAVLRLVPNKRWVVQATWQNKTVMAKIFNDKTRYQRELKGIERCQNAKILIPQLLYQGLVTKENVYILIFEFVPKDKDHELDLLDNLIKTVALHHDNGIMQTDMHVGNFIKNNNQVVSLDAASIVSLKEPLSNLALLLAQFWTLNFDQMKSHLKTYGQYRKMTFSKDDVAFFTQKVEQLKEKRKTDKVKKIFRESSSVTYFSGLKYKILMRNDAFSPQLSYFLHHIEEASPSSSYVVERYKDWNVLAPSKAAKRWRELHIAEFTHQVDIIPVAIVEKSGFFNKISYFIGRQPQ